MAYNWAKIKNDWLTGMRNIDIQKKWKVSKASLANYIKDWKKEEEENKTNNKTKNNNVEQDAVSQVWNSLVEKNSKYVNYTDNQKMFVLYCAFGLTPLEAYKKAGYSTNSQHLSVRASELKRKLNDAITEAKNLVKVKCDIDQDDILKFMQDVLHSDITDFLDYGVEEKQKATRFGIINYDTNVIRLKPKEEINTKLIKTLRISKDGNFELELYSKEIAIDFFTRYFDMFTKDGKDTLIESNMSKMLSLINNDGSNINVSEDENDDIIDDEENENE